MNSTVLVIVRTVRRPQRLREHGGPEFSGVTAEHLAIEEIALAGDPFVSPHCHWARASL
jgi:hypothetical protein